MDEKIRTLIQPVTQFLHCTTPAAWLRMAAQAENQQALLLDHLHCELKAAQSAAFLIRRYAPDSLLAKHVLIWLKPYEDFLYRGEGDGRFQGGTGVSRSESQVRGDDTVVNELIGKMVLLIKEELHHFEQVLEIMQRRNIELEPISAARYAAGLRTHIRTHEPAAFIDKLIVGAYIEARSCERFAALAPMLDDELARFYTSLLRSEARHYQDYLQLARMIAEQAGTPQRAVDDRIQYFGEVEAELIKTQDNEFRFHSGKPANVVAG
ncbi:tRNA isopentenyl-2-thiomethyl-A-37 hydroxylase MiaE [Aliidiomarina soli]|uniref:tRNA-(Ms[2]io[6]A)-hydroxylase n=1 Tax=Aliidiomarina soli TaxID=1928574 RepID=A0A432WL30_9GAMM|nr:tRNA isopentenyl-2-thiomethyl-A-37 hydroxylase MiaE [Aliidiomarina soli]RUO34458.1 tRNA-(ms[2]io[6]A)-hydroxylase [Aliidiomarina soli]